MFDNTPLPATWDEVLRRYRDDGWSATLLTFMFDHMPGNRLAIQAQQRAELEAMYRWTLTRIVRDPRPSMVDHLPVWLCSPDFPVSKRGKQALRDVTINDGQHQHAYALTPPGSRLRNRSLEQLICGEQEDLTRHRRCTRVDAVPITYNHEGVLGYARKSEERGRIDGDAFFILPRSMSELRDGSDRVGRQASIFAAPKRTKK